MSARTSQVRSLPLVAAIVFALVLGSFAQPAAADDGALFDASGLTAPDGDAAATPASIAKLTGEVEIWLRLADPPLSRAYGDDGKREGGKLTSARQRAYVAELTRKQNAVMARVAAYGGRELGRVTKAHNAIAVAIDASKIASLASIAEISTIRPVVEYELDLSETVPYVGASAVQTAGFDGSGVKVAVLDSGVDYTHRSLGGAGTLAAYQAAYGTNVADPKNTTTDGLFPTAKVVGGFDFVGEAWRGGAGTPPIKEDADPIDCGPQAIAAPCAGGHGTHVSDIIAGKSLVGSHRGVAPGASLLAIKVCSAVSNFCNGIALLKGVDFALDPNSDGDISDAADVMNLSLGSSYGQREDDLSEATANAVRLGVVVVASAGNGADRPYILGSPSSAAEVISVAQTQVPSALLHVISAGGVSVGGIHQPWSAAPAAVNGALTYDITSLSTRRGCTDAAGANPWAAGAHAGKVLLIDRGLCAVSRKVSNAAAAGAVASIVANNVPQGPGDLPPSFSFGGGTPTIAGYTLTLADGNALKAKVLALATIDPSAAASLVRTMVSSSSRGPSYSTNAIKPDIGAPGASLSAEAGTGTEETAFGGTSGSAPMVTGAAALLVQKFPARKPSEIKSLLMNTAETNIRLNPVAAPSIIAPISRVGGGELRVDKAASSTTAAWDEDTRTGSLSYGYHAVASKTTVKRTVTVRNYSSSSRTYSIGTSFRDPADAASGAVAIDAPSSLRVSGNSSRTFDVRLIIDPTKLPLWDLNGGSRGGDGFRLQGVEFDGWVTLAGGADTVHLAWQVLPHRAARVQVRGGGDGDDDSDEDGRGEGDDKDSRRDDDEDDDDKDDDDKDDARATFRLDNSRGARSGRFDSFALTGTSDRIKKKFLPQPGENFAIIDLRSVGVRQVDIGGGAFGVQFAINTFGERAHPNYPAEFDIFVDNDNDGDFDFVVFNLENGGFGATGQNVVGVFTLPNGPFSVFFFTDADLNSANAILTAPLSALGLTAATKFRFSVFAFDNYFTGQLTDAIENMTVTLGTPRFVSSASSGDVPAGSRSTLTVSKGSGGQAASPSQTGILLLFRDARPGEEAATLTLDRRDDDEDDD